MDKSILVNSEVNEFVLPIYDLQVTRVWRGHGNIIFVELGNLNGGKGEYTLWVSTNLWKIDTDDISFDGDEEPYEAIDKRILQLENLKVTNVNFDKDSKIVTVTFSDEQRLVATIADTDSFVSIIFNEDKKYLNFEFDGTATFDIGGHKKSSGVA